jgi:aldehyde:ferredoxin oxidoreductase
MAYLAGGGILKVDLGSGQIRTESSKPYMDKWLGGRGLNAGLLYELSGPKTDPLGPDNPLIFSVGPLTGTMAPGSGRVEVSAKSPASGLQGMSNMGGYWGPELKYAGYDSLVVSGQADRPVYLAINNGKVEIKDAAHLWGRDTIATADMIRAELRDPEVEVLCIGPAGEKQIAYASLHNRTGNAAGRTGMGTVMGSKKLKAVAVRGTKGVQIARPEEFLETCLAGLAKQKPLVGMATTTDLADNEPYTWALTLGNYDATKWEMAKKLKNGHVPYWERHKNPQGQGKMGCFNCQVRCMDYYAREGKGVVTASCNVYASTTWVLKMPGMDDWFDFVQACQKHGVDVMSAARMIAWAIQLYEDGRITSADTGGIVLEWGKGPAILAMLDLIAKKEGFGEVLAANVDQAAGMIGPDVEPALSIKNIPLGGTNVMNFRQRSIGAMVNPRGSDEYRGRFGSFDNLGTGKDTGMTGMATPEAWEAQEAVRIVDKHLAKLRESGEKELLNQHDYESRGEISALGYKLIAVTDSLVQCKWNTVFLNVGLGIEFQAAALSAGYGREITVDELMQTAKRIAAQERAYAVRLGLTSEKDALPKKFYQQAMEGSWPEDTLDEAGTGHMKREFYESMGWDPQTGIPLKETLEQLGLADAARDLKGQGGQS